MSTRISIPSFLALIFVLLLTAGCKIQITVPAGGKVVSASHAYDCDSGQTCVVEVNDFYFAETFDAHADAGWVFVGWKLGPGYLCARSESVCHLSNKGLGQYEAIVAILESDETFFLEPEFVEGTPLDEALAGVSDEGLRNCLSKAPPPRRYAEQVRSVACNTSSRITSVEGIQAFRRIERLSLLGSESLTDLQPLGKLSRLTYLSLILSSPYFNAAALDELELLDYLFLGFFLPVGAPNPDLSEMGNLQNLRRLGLGTLGFLDLNAITSLVNLRELSVSYSQVSDISPIAGLTKLETLNLGSQRISDISPLAGMTRLKTLDLGSNQINDIRPLAGMRNLAVLDISYNKIGWIGPLTGLKNLKVLNLSLNHISDISPLAGMTRLETLNLSSNQISDISPLAEMHSVPELNLSDNLIQDASPLKQHYPLTLDPSFGHGVDFSYRYCWANTDSSVGVSLDLSNNPITSIGDALNGIRAGAVFLIDVPLSCQEYPRLEGLYDSRAIINDWHSDGGYGAVCTYNLPERCL